MVLALDEVVIGACEVFEELHDPREITLKRVYGTTTTTRGHGCTGKRAEKLKSVEEGHSRGDSVRDTEKNGLIKRTGRGSSHTDTSNAMDVEVAEEVADEIEEEEDSHVIGKVSSVRRCKGSGISVSTGRTVGGLPVDPSKCLEVRIFIHPTPPYPTPALHSPSPRLYFITIFLSLLYHRFPPLVSLSLPAPPPCQRCYRRAGKDRVHAERP